MWKRSIELFIQDLYQVISNSSHLWNKATLAYRQGRFPHALHSRVKPILYGLRFLIHDPASDHILLHCPDYLDPPQDEKELAIVNRIFQSFRNMKEAQQHAPAYYKPSSQWEAYLGSYSYLNEGLESNDLNKFHFFLANFGTWKDYHAIEASTLIRENMRSLTRRRYLKNVVFYRQLKLWEWFSGKRRPISCLSYPTHGNQAGAYIDGVFVGCGSFFNEVYASILSELISDIDHPVVADLGAGYGKLAYFMLRNRDKFTFIDFDLPETLCLAAYYLLKTWPNKKTLLYGEEQYSPETHKKYELIFMPSYEISKIGTSSVDLFVNKNSLGEMTREAVSNYVTYITKATRYFFHMNHEVYPQVFSDDARGMLGYEYPISRDNFKLLSRYPELGGMLFEGGVDFRKDIFVYLYERVKRG